MGAYGMDRTDGSIGAQHRWKGLTFLGFRTLEDMFSGIVVWGGALLVLSVSLWILGGIVRHGIGQLSLTLFLELPRDAGRAGGLSSILVSTLLLLTVALVVAIPMGLGTAIVLSEYTRQQRPLGRGCVSVLTYWREFLPLSLGSSEMPYFASSSGWDSRSCPGV
jgi:hypothetical protein